MFYQGIPHVRLRVHTWPVAHWPLAEWIRYNLAQSRAGRQGHEVRLRTPSGRRTWALTRRGKLPR